MVNGLPLGGKRITARWQTNYRSVVNELPLGNHTTTRWYAGYHSVVRTLPLGGTHATIRWYSCHLSVFDIRTLEIREFSFFAGYRNDSLSQLSEVINCLEGCTLVTGYTEAKRTCARCVMQGITCLEGTTFYNWRYCLPGRDYFLSLIRAHPLASLVYVPGF